MPPPQEKYWKIWKTKNKLLEKALEKRAPAQPRPITFKEKAGKDTTDTNEEEDEAMEEMDVSLIQERHHREDDDDDKPRRK